MNKNLTITPDSGLTSFQLGEETYDNASSEKAILNEFTIKPTLKYTLMMKSKRMLNQNVSTRRI